MRFVNGQLIGQGIRDKVMYKGDRPKQEINAKGCDLLVWDKANKKVKGQGRYR
jgi:hypothetical protein